MQKNSSTTYTYGQGKYYVLAVDLDFDASGAPEEKPLYGFGGTLYGLGHTISNWKYTESSSNTEECVGLIRYTFWGANTEVVIADLSMDGYSISDVNCLNGSIVGGTVSSNGYILNCHAKGSISRLTAKGTWIYGGGIVGGMKMPNNQIGKYEGNTTIYRCSANTEFTIVDNTVPAGNSFGFGGIIGVNDYRCNTFIYDCYANSIYSADVAHNGVKLNGIFVGGIAGECIVGSIQGLGGTTYISGCVSKLINDFSTNPPIAWYNGGVASFHENPNATASSIATVENCYVSGTTKWIDTKNTAAKHCHGFLRTQILRILVLAIKGVY